MKVNGLFRCFDELMRDFPIEILADRTMVKTELLEISTEFYPPVKQVKFGVLVGSGLGHWDNTKMQSDQVVLT